MADNASYAVDTTAPTVTLTDNVAATANGDVTLTFTFSEAVTGFDASKVTLSSGTKGTFTTVNSTVYTLVITPPAGSAGTITVTTSTAGVVDAAGNPATAPAAYSQAFDTQAPTVSAVAITGATGAQSSTLSAGDVVTATVTFSEVVTVTGTPQLALTIGSTPVQASYVSGSGSNALTFTYTIAAGQTDTNGIAIAANALSLNGGTLLGATGNNATLSHAGVADNAGYKVDTTAPTLTVNQTNSTIAGDGQISATEYSAGVTLSGQTSVGHNVTISTGNGTDVTVTASVVNGVWSATVPSANLPTSGSVTFTITSSDAAGNTATFTRTASLNPAIQLSEVAAGLGGFVINGQGASDESGYSVSGAGDVNGDGLADLIVGAPFSDPAAGDLAGRSYVVFGTTATAPVNLSAVAAGTGGFVINGQGASDASGFSVSAAGDINGDGLADFIVGAPYSDPAAGAEAGRSYVVFGTTATAPVNLSAVAAGVGGFVINGQGAIDRSGISVSGAGDVNGDGLADLIVSANRYASFTGRSYVVFGTAGTTSVDLSAVAAGTGGFVIYGESSGDASSANFVSGAGDVNGDGLADIVIGAEGSDPAAGVNAGRSYVVFGTTATARVNLSAVAAGTGGFVINGQGASDRSGVSVSIAGDVNGDGLADLIVGAYEGRPSDSRGNTGRSYVVFGTTATAPVDLSAVAAGTGGFVINGQSAGDGSGQYVSDAGDMNGDGLADLIVASPYSDLQSFNSNEGRSYVVYGRSSTTAVELSAVAAGTGGFVINGQSAQDFSGVGVSAAGDVNGDGLADLIVGAHRSDPAGNAEAGRSYVIFGTALGSAVDQTGDTGDNALNSSGGQTLVGNAGNDTLVSGGADVLYGGPGLDTFAVGATMATALQNVLGAGGNTTQLARIDGGSGVDTLRLTGGANLDLTAIANVGGATPNGLSRVESIEKIDLATDTAANTLKLALRDVIDMSGMNLFNTGNGWTNISGAPLSAMVQRYQLVIDGTASDTVQVAGGSDWTSAGTASSSISGAAQSYNVWNHNTSAAQLLIDVDIIREAVL